MKKTTYLLFALLPSMVIGQQSIQKSMKATNGLTPVKHNVTKKYGYMDKIVPGVNNTGNRSFTQNEIGTTFYDLQTNSSNQRRIVNHGDGSLSASFTFGENSAAGYTDRGAGYNYFDGSSWQANATSRVETTRNGWPSITSSGGNEIITSHSGNGGLTLNIRSTKGTGAWTESIIPTNLGATKDILWPRVAIGGGNDSTIHVLGVVLDRVDTNFRLKGLQSPVLYYRSQDLGATWDIIDSLIPGIDSNEYFFIGGDNYSIDARKNVVAFSVFPGFADLKTFKSTDNGDTWTEHIVNDFPITKYEADSGIDLDSNMIQDSNLLFTTDGSGSVLIDDNDQVHVTFGVDYVVDWDLTDGFTSHFPLTGILAYWNESYGNDSVIGIAGYKDYDNNDTVISGDFNGGGQSAVTNNPEYRVSGVSMPSMGKSTDGKIYVTYAAFSEIHTNGTQNFRHIYVIKTNDGGVNWTEPADFTPDFDFNLLEHVYPSMAKLVDNNVHIVYQRDQTPGTSVVDETPANFNQIMYLQVDSALREPVVGLEENINTFNINLYPNPTQNDITLTVNSREFTGNVTVSIADALGRVVKTLPLAVSANQTQVNLAVSNLKNGVYNVIINGENAISSKTFVKQ